MTGSRSVRSTERPFSSMGPNGMSLASGFCSSSSSEESLLLEPPNGLNHFCAAAGGASAVVANRKRRARRGAERGKGARTERIRISLFADLHSGHPLGHLVAPGLEFY